MTFWILYITICNMILNTFYSSFSFFFLSLCLTYFSFVSRFPFLFFISSSSNLDNNNRRQQCSQCDHKLEVTLNYSSITDTLLWSLIFASLEIEGRGGNFIKMMTVNSNIEFQWIIYRTRTILTRVGKRMNIELKNSINIRMISNITVIELLIVLT